MNKHHPYNKIIEKKLEQLPVGDTDLLWNEMHLILDEKMPQKKEKRRFFLWFLFSNGFLLLTISIIIAGTSLYLLFKRQESAALIKKLAEASQFNNAGNKNPTTNYTVEKTTLAVDKQNKKSSNNIFVGSVLAKGEVENIQNTFLEVKTIYEVKKQQERNRFTVALQDLSIPGFNYDIAAIDPRSLKADLIHESVNGAEKNSLNQQQETNTDKEKNGTRRKERQAYAGIISGVDISSVKFNSGKAGGTMGVIIGYPLNEKFSIESGLLWDTKKVYDNGDHFKLNGFTPSNGVKIVAVNGRSKIYEVPINIKYTIKPGKSSLFATAGLSSYFMRLENYDYEYTQNNQPGGHNYLSYKNKTQDLFSVVNLSVGFIRKLNDRGSIRIEPYLKLPLKNIGVCNMPITSTGLNIGFIKTLR